MVSPLAATASLPQLEAALQASWVRQTAYLGAYQLGNPALGQCYPTSRVVQWFYPSLEIAAGQVDTGVSTEAHFWSVDQTLVPPKHLDLTWQQFPAASQVLDFRIINRHSLGDSPPTIARCKLLLRRVLERLGSDENGMVGAFQTDLRSGSYADLE